MASIHSTTDIAGNDLRARVEQEMRRLRVWQIARCPACREGVFRGDDRIKIDGEIFHATCATAESRRLQAD